MKGLIRKSGNLAVMGRDLVWGIFRYKQLTGSPIVIGGCERSGTTMLHRILSAHPNVLAIPDETWALCHSRAAGFESDGGAIRKGRLLRYLGKIPKRHYEGKEPTRWSEKSPANIYHFAEIKEAFAHDVKLIQIVRDGRDVVTSMHQGKANEPWVSPGRWVASVRVGMEYLGDPEVLTTKYEDIVLDFDNEMARICDFLGYASVPRQVREWTRYTPIRQHHSGEIRTLAGESIGKWKKNSAQWQARVAFLMEDPEAVGLLKQYGYV